MGIAGEPDFEETATMDAGRNANGVFMPNYQNWNNGLQNTLGNIGQSQNYYLNQMQGRNSVAQQQLQQGLQQNVSAQRSQAAGAAPQNSAMAARNAQMNSARLGYGMSGQAATAGLQERNQAAQQLGQSQLQEGQLQSGAAQTAGNLYNQAQGNALQGGSNLANYSPWWSGMLSGAGSAAAVMSDERLKENVAGADAASKKALGRLNAVSYDYKDQKHGKGRQFGVMAQDLERAGLGHTIIESIAGKAVDTGRLERVAERGQLVEVGEDVGAFLVGERLGCLRVVQQRRRIVRVVEERIDRAGVLGAHRRPAHCCVTVPP